MAEIKVYQKSLDNRRMITMEEMKKMYPHMICTCPPGEYNPETYCDHCKECDHADDMIDATKDNDND